MKKNYSEIIMILDRSGSMSKISNDTIGSFNSFIAEQKLKKDKRDFSLVLFNGSRELVIDKKDIKEVEDLNISTYRPNGSTALLDTIGITIDKVGDRLYCTPESERPENVIVVILTDGEENASVVFSNENIAEKIKHQTEKYNWKFVFLGANQDSFSNSSKINIQKSYTANFAATGEGIKLAYCSLNRAVDSYCTGNDYDISKDSQTVISNKT